ncbi:hypothetical protein ACWD3J_25470 [Streptomyces sp. NPDC002755]|uniref:hypothetical protein n=1 Tax=Streptomyces sp. NPDC002884 TaxID=3154544 RepID=UPI00332F1DC8
MDQQNAQQDARQYAQQCSELFAAGGHAAVRRTAQAGLREAGPDVVLYRWLGQAHAAEDDDDHDAEAESAYRQGLKLDPDDLGLLVCYLELCLRADAFDYPGRARRAVTLRARIDELAPEGSPHRERVDAALGWAGRGYWDDLAASFTVAQTTQAQMDDLGKQVGEAVRAPADGGSGAAKDGEDLHAAELAAASELLRGRRNAPLRLLLAHRGAAYAVTLLASFAVNRSLTASGLVGFSLWGWLLYLPLLAAEARLRAARKLARQRVVARIEARHASSSAPSTTP